MVRAIVTDIEGTTSSLSFVKDVLFPYSRAALPEFIARHGSDPAVAAILADVNGIAGHTLTRDEAVAQLLQWIDEDRKITPLKTLQGMIWKEGYRAGKFKGHIYEDAARNLKIWHARGIRLAVFSSGSVQAQQLLFAHTPYGDLTNLFSDYFDTRIGSKRERPAYEHIAAHLGIPAANILFLSDITEELDAARSAGILTCQLVRDSQIKPGAHPQAPDFDHLPSGLLDS